MPIGAAGIAGLEIGANILGGIFQAATAGKMNRATRSHQAEMYAASVRDNRENWRMQNEYNSPVAQMARLKAAGLNPNLMYGSPQGGGNATQVADSGQMQQYNPKSIENPIPQGMIANLYNLKLQDAQTNLLRQKTETENFNTKLTAITTALRALQVQEQEAKNYVQKRTINTQISLLQQELRNLVQDEKLKSAQTRVQEVTAPKIEAETKAILDKNLMDWKMNKASLARINQEMLESKTRQQKMNAEMGLIGAQKDESATRQNLNKLDAKIKEFDYLLMRLGINKNDNAVQALLRMVMNVDESIDTRLANTEKAIEQLRNMSK